MQKYVLSCMETSLFQVAQKNISLPSKGGFTACAILDMVSYDNWFSLTSFILYIIIYSLYVLLNILHIHTQEQSPKHTQNREFPMWANFCMQASAEFDTAALCCLLLLKMYTNSCKQC